MEFSKKLLLFSWTVTLCVTVLAVIVPMCGGIADGLFVVTPLSWAETGAATAFYYWKSKNENRAKYAQRFLKNFAKDYGEETALRLAEIVLKD